MANLCEIGAGYTARKGLEVAATGGVIAAQLGDVRDGRPVDPLTLRRFELESLPGRFIAGPGDVLFRSKGNPSTAAIVAPDCTEALAVFQPLMILRPRLGQILPEYLVWAINRQTAQRYFSAAAQGTTIRSISKAALESLPVPVPSLDMQKKIASVYRLSTREADLLRELADKRELITALTLEKIITERGVAT